MAERPQTTRSFWPKEVVSLQNTCSMAFGFRETLVLGAVASMALFYTGMAFDNSGNELRYLLRGVLLIIQGDQNICEVATFHCVAKV
jgi:hypothetical protein